ncbi:MAG: dihydrolipoamide acetyltransferase family protein [Chloroflexota bacterium]|nr:dihydrolipoamide acetyltransferase family protein [Chloroflexota bacterium]
MAISVLMPRMGYDTQEAIVVKWLKAEGDHVNLGEDIAEIETDKAIVPMPSGATGTLLKQIAAEGDTVPVGQLLAIIGQPGEEISQLMAGAPSVAKPATAPPASPGAAAPAFSAPSTAPEGVRASPIARKLAADRGVDLALVTGTGPNGRITEADVAAFAEQTASAAGEPEAETGAELVPLSRMRQAIARLTARSKSEIPHFYMAIEVSADPALALRSEVNPRLQAQNVRISVHDMVVKACALALQKHPTLNSSFKGDALEYHASVNIGVVIDMDQEGIIVPALLDCQDKSILQLSTEGRDLVRRAKENALRPEELTGGTFSISNLGSLGVSTFSAVVHPPNAAILAVGAIRKEPVVRGDEIVVGQMMNLTVSVDHRIEDGVAAAKFLGELKRLLEHPQELLPEELQ